MTATARMMLMVRMVLMVLYDEAVVMFDGDEVITG